MARRKVSVYVKCPFYKNENGARICCAGVVEGTYIHQNFPDADQRKKYQRQYCKGDWQRCWLTKMEVEIGNEDEKRSAQKRAGESESSLG